MQGAKHALADEGASPDGLGLCAAMQSVALRPEAALTALPGVVPDVMPEALLTREVLEITPLAVSAKSGVEEEPSTAAPVPIGSGACSVSTPQVADAAAREQPLDESIAELMRSAEDANVGLHVRPRRGSACIFWTMNEAGVDPASWHNGARVCNGGNGKWIAQKFKEIPIAYRKQRPVALPASLLLPPLTIQRQLYGI